MLSQELKEEIVSMWKKGDSISKISKEKKVSRPTVRKIVEEHKKNRNWWLTRTYGQDNFVRIVVNTSYRIEKSGESAIARLALGVEHREVEGLIRQIVKKDTAYDILSEFGKDPPRISVLYIKRSELLPEVRRDTWVYY